MPTSNLQIVTTDDDVRWDNGGFGFAKTDAMPKFGKWFSGTGQDSMAYRFPSSGVPEGATVTSAILTLTAAGNDSGTGTNIRIYCEDVAAPAQVADSTAALALVKTTSYTEDIDVVDFTTDTEYNFDITNPVQEVVNVVGFNGTINVLVIGLSGSTTGRSVYDYSGSTTKAAKLAITYSSGGEGVTRRFFSIIS